MFHKLPGVFWCKLHIVHTGMIYFMWSLLSGIIVMSVKSLDLVVTVKHDRLNGLWNLCQGCQVCAAHWKFVWKVEKRFGLAFLLLEDLEVLFKEMHVWIIGVKKVLWDVCQRVCRFLFPDHRIFHTLHSTCSGWELFLFESFQHRCEYFNDFRVLAKRCKTTDHIKK